MAKEDDAKEAVAVTVSIGKGKESVRLTTPIPMTTPIENNGFLYGAYFRAFGNKQILSKMFTHDEKSGVFEFDNTGVEKFAEKFIQEKVDNKKKHLVEVSQENVQASKRRRGLAPLPGATAAIEAGTADEKTPDAVDEDK